LAPAAATSLQSNIYPSDAYSKLIRPRGESGTAIPVTSPTTDTSEPLTGTEEYQANISLSGGIDPWVNPTPWAQVDPATGDLLAYKSTVRIAEDVILTNVIGFDVKAFDVRAPLYLSGTEVLAPGDTGYATNLAANTTPTSTGAYVDLGYGMNITNGPGKSDFSGPGNATSRLQGIYDTWSFHYEHDGINQGDWMVNASNSPVPVDGMNKRSAVTDEGADGFDNNGINGIDDAGELEAPPPYAVPLRGIQVKIRIFEPDARQIREVTVMQDFVPG
jgi:hypothetical protein